jgi:polyhydroxyalkanoate synthesis regulator phasin
MPALQTMFKDAWSQAVAGVNAAEQGAEKVLGRIAGAAGFAPDDVKRQARDLTEKLQSQRRSLEKALDEAMKKAAGRFLLPTKGEVAELRQRVEELSTRVDALAAGRDRPAGQA